MDDVAVGVALDGAVRPRQRLLVAQQKPLVLAVLHDGRLAVSIRRHDAVPLAIVEDLRKNDPLFPLG